MSNIKKLISMIFNILRSAVVIMLAYFVIDKMMEDIGIKQSHIETIEKNIYWLDQDIKKVQFNQAVLMNK